MYLIFNKPEAEADALEAANWYESQQAGLGDEFIDELEDLYSYLEFNPFLFPKTYLSVRQAPLKRFPYVVLYTIEKRKVFVLAVFNCYQHPRKKRKH
ncbi:MAG: type II toxin-antitoxin system RelE/ParE family toxin [Bacteroidota bacterium]